MKKIFGVLSLTMFLLLVSCSKDDPIDPGTTPEFVTVSNLDTDTTGGRTWTFYSFREKKAIDKADSATTKWDIAFNRTDIICNSGVRGPGNGAIQLLSGTDFVDLKTAPETGYFQETALSPFAIRQSNTAKWYNYNQDTHIITPVPGTVIVLKTADGKYVKIRMISYYQGNPVKPDDLSKARFLYFEFAYQPDGTRNFE
jgi:hypothetical protein